MIEPAKVWQSAYWLELITDYERMIADLKARRPSGWEADVKHSTETLSMVYGALVATQAEEAARPTWMAWQWMAAEERAIGKMQLALAYPHEEGDIQTHLIQSTQAEIDFYRASRLRALESLLVGVRPNA